LNLYNRKAAENKRLVKRLLYTVIPPQYLSISFADNLFAIINKNNVQATYKRSAITTKNNGLRILTVAEV